MLRILQGSEANQFEGIATGDDSWFRDPCPSSEMFTRSPAEMIPRTPQAIGAKKTMTTLFLTARKLIVLDVMSKGYKYNQQYFMNYVFPDLKKANLSSHGRMPESAL
jgi:hypothetical protein